MGTKFPLFPENTFLCLLLWSWADFVTKSETSREVSVIVETSGEVSEIVRNLRGGF